MTTGPRRSVVTVGNFDGVHIGHRALLGFARRLADRAGAPLVVATFDRHPLATLSPAGAPPLLTAADHKAELLSEAGADEVLVLAFDRARADQPAEDFVVEVLVGRLAARAVVVGANFRFGKAAGGDVALLRRLGAEHGFDAHGVELRGEDGGVVSSSRIRGLVAAGRLARAATFLARPHELRLLRPPGALELPVPNELVSPPPGRYVALVGALDAPPGEVAVTVARPASGGGALLGFPGPGLPDDGDCGAGGIWRVAFPDDAAVAEATLAGPPEAPAGR